MRRRSRCRRSQAGRRGRCPLHEEREQVGRPDAAVVVEVPRAGAAHLEERICPEL